MAQNKIEFKKGDLHFNGEGETSWLTQQIDKILGISPARSAASKKAGAKKAAAPKAAAAPKKSRKRKGRKAKAKKAAAPKAPAKAAKKAAAPSGGGELAKFIRDKKANVNQRATFLAAAVWVSRKGKSNFQTVDVTKSINSSGVKKLINPSQSMGQNLKMGMIKKSGGGYIVTPKGFASVK